MVNKQLAETAHVTGVSANTIKAALEAATGDRGPGPPRTAGEIEASCADSVVAGPRTSVCRRQDR